MLSRSDFNTGQNMITGRCGERNFFLGPSRSFSCGTQPHRRDEALQRHLHHAGVAGDCARQLCVWAPRGPRAPHRPLPSRHCASHARADARRGEPLAPSPSRRRTATACGQPIRDACFAHTPGTFIAQLFHRSHPPPPLSPPPLEMASRRPRRAELLVARAAQRQTRRLPTVGALPHVGNG